MGAFLVHSEPPVPADAIFVFAGDWTGHRILKAAELRRQGYANRVLVSSPEKLFGEPEGYLAIRYAVRHGYPESWFEPVMLNAHSTRQEAQQLAGELARRHIRTLLAVTSDFHTARAGRTLRRAVGHDVRVTMVAAPYPFFSADGWWKTREGQKTVFDEYSKTIAYTFGL